MPSTASSMSKAASTSCSFAPLRAAAHPKLLPGSEAPTSFARGTRGPCGGHASSAKTCFWERSKNSIAWWRIGCWLLPARYAGLAGQFFPHAVFATGKSLMHRRRQRGLAAFRRASDAASSSHRARTSCHRASVSDAAVLALDVEVRRGSFGLDAGDAAGFIDAESALSAWPMPPSSARYRCGAISRAQGHRPRRLENGAGRGYAS